MSTRQAMYYNAATSCFRRIVLAKKKAIRTTYAKCVSRAVRNKVVSPRPGNFFFLKTRDQSQHIYSSVTFQIF